MADLVRGRYHVTNPTWSILGQGTNATQSDIAVRSNLDVFGLTNVTSTTIVGTSGQVTSVAIPVEYGDIITKVGLWVTATIASTPTHQFAALYSGVATTPALLAQSTDTTTAAQTANALNNYTLASAVLITPANAPNGYIYASFSWTGTAGPTVASVSTPTAGLNYGQLPYSTSPIFYAMTHGSAVAGTAPSTIASASAAATGPALFLS
jgi:hypothetical protein